MELPMPDLEELLGGTNSDLGRSCCAFDSAEAFRAVTTLVD